MTATHVGRAWSCTVRVVVADATALDAATQDLYALLARVDRAASRFRADSELTRANVHAGRPVPISLLLVELVDSARRMAVHTGGAVDPTLGLTMRRIGYDRDISEVAELGPAPVPLEATPRHPSVPAWRGLRLHQVTGLLTVPRGSALDLGATAKAQTADLAAAMLARRYGTGVLVELGGDVAVAGARREGWRIRVAEREGGGGQLVLLHGGGIATSTTTVRRWHRGGTAMHHIVDPRTGRPADGPWRTATVCAADALHANAASTAAIVLGDDAVDWLETHGYAARLVSRTGAVHTTTGWPVPTDLAATS